MSNQLIGDTAQLALAAYGQFYQQGKPLERDLTTLNTDESGFAVAQAARFIEMFEIAIPTYNDATSSNPNTSFDVTVFAGPVMGSSAGNRNIYIAFRGTQQKFESPDDLIGASAKILTEGAAVDQIVAMYNWFQRVATPNGRSVVQYGVVEIDLLTLPPEGAVRLGPAIDVVTGTTRYLVRRPDAVANGDLVKLMVGDPDGRVTVTGSSLGGHLAMAFAGLFPQSVSQAVAFNSPGFAATPTIDRVFAMLGGARPLPGQDGILNVFSLESTDTQQITELIAGLHNEPGLRIDVPIENQYGSDVIDPKRPSYNHDQRQVTDSLSTFEMLRRLDPTLTLSTFHRLLRAAAEGETRSLESLIDSVQALVGLGNDRLPSGNSERNALHAALTELSANLIYQSLAGQIRWIQGHSPDLARRDFGAHVSLVEGLPLVATLVDPAPTSPASLLLYGAHRSVYERWVADRQEPLAAGEPWRLHFGAAYLEERADFLNLVGQRFATNEVGVTVDLTKTADTLFADVRSGIAFMVDGGVTPSLSALAKLVRFGDSGPNELSGNVLDDKVFAGDGNDAVAGHAGNDWLEGQAGADTLTGGAGSDTLLGGHGDDLYAFATGSGADWLADADGVGRLEWNGAALPQGRRLRDGVWQSADGQVSYVLTDTGSGRRDLVVAFGREDGVIIRGWSTDRALGIDLQDAPAPPKPADATFSGDFKRRLDPSGTRYLVVEGRYVADGALPGAADLLSGTFDRDSIDGHGGNDGINAGDGDDAVAGGAGNDLIAGGAGADVIDGGEGDDIIFAAGTVGFRLPTDPSAAAPQGGRWAGLSWAVGTAKGYLDGLLAATVLGDDDGNVVDGGAGDDDLRGGRGRDVLMGGAGHDEAQGAGGNDLLGGGSGDDTMAGDNPAVVDIWLDGTSVTRLEDAAHGADTLDGGDGNDRLFGDGADDVLYGGAGNDELHGDRQPAQGAPAAVHGHDQLDGGAGDDRLWGHGGADTLDGGDGHDMLAGDYEAAVLPEAVHAGDRLDGGLGNDSLFGQGGDDTLRGGEGNDWLAGEDQLSLGAASSLSGNDLLDGGSGQDTLLGGNGDDTLRGGDGPDHLDGGAGDDRIEAGGAVADAASGTLIVDTVVAREGRDTLVLAIGRSDVQVTRRDDGMVFVRDRRDGAGVVDGLSSSLVQVALADGTVSWRRLVNEHLDGPVTQASAGAGSTLLGGRGADTLTVAADHAGVVVSAGPGNDRLRIDAAGGATVQFAPGDGLDEWSAVPRGPAAADGPAARTVLALDEGIAPEDVWLVRAPDGRHTLTLGGGDGIRFSPAGGVAAASAEAPASTYPLDEIRYADGRVETLAEVAARGVAVLPVATAGADRVVLTPASDAFNADSGDDHVDGGAGNDTLRGGNGHDTLIGGDGHDALHGDDGRNHLIGGAGNDTAFDAGGNDTVALGEGDDSYHYWTGTDEALDDSRTSADRYQVRPTVSYDGYSTYRWTIRDHGGADSLHLDHGLTPAETTVRHAGGALRLALRFGTEVVIDGAVRPDGTLDPSRQIESVRFADGTTWTVADLQRLSLQSTASADRIRGFAGNDTIDGGGGYDDVWGGSGDDVLSAGRDGGWLRGGAGDDVYRVRAGDGPVRLGEGGAGGEDNAGQDTLELDVARSAVTVDLLRASASDGQPDTLRLRWLDGSAQADIALRGNAGDDLAVDRVRFADGSAVALATLVPLQTVTHHQGHGGTALVGSTLGEVIQGRDGITWLDGRDGDDRLVGTAADEVLYGGPGADVLIGGGGNDRIALEGVGDTVRLHAGSGRDVVFAANPHALSRGDGGHRIQLDATLPVAGIGAARWDTVSGHLDLALNATGDTLSVTEDLLAQDQLRLVFADGTRWSAADLVARANQPTEGADRLVDAAGTGLLDGAGGNDTLIGRGGHDLLRGGAGADTLDGGDGADTLEGGPGVDELLLDGSADILRWQLGDGIDRADSEYGARGITLEFGSGLAASRFTANAALDAGRNHFSRTLAIDGTGLRLVNADNAADLPEALRFADGDTWTQDRVRLQLLAGTPAADALAGFDDTDDLLDGSAGNDTLWGGRGADTLRGGDGDDVLHATGPRWGDWWDSGADLLVGGAGNDTLHAVDGTRLRVDAGFGRDVVHASGRLAIEWGAGLAPSALWAAHGVGGELRLGVRGAGDELRVVSFFRSDASHDDLAMALGTMPFDGGPAWSWAEVRALLNDGAPGSDVRVAGAGVDVIAWGAGGGDDQVVGLGAGDQLAVDASLASSGVSVWRTAGGDLLLVDDVSGATMQLVGSAGPDAGHGAVVRFADGTRWTMAMLQQRVAGTLLTGTEGSDGLQAAGPSRLLGRGGADRLVGSAGADVLDGGAGVDTLQGGAGDDLYVVDAADTVTEASGGGTDEVWAAVGFTLPRHVEHLRLTGAAAVDGTGNTLANRLVGNAARNTLDGRAGADTLHGGAGDDTYVVDHAGDTVLETADEGRDLVRASVAWVLGAHIEDLTLTGNAGLAGTGNAMANTLRGNAGANRLDGGAGRDTLVGGGGNDTYVVDQAGDRIVEAAGGGTDTVLSPLTWTLGAELERLTLTGSDAVDGTGNDLDNQLNGNAAANRLDGGAGADTLTGGDGDDTYVVDHIGDRIVENANQGVDTVRAPLSWTLGAHLEHLVLTGAGAVAGTGNAAANRLTGNGAANTLAGGAGDDTLDGGAGDDTLMGGTGADTYLFGRGDGVDTLLEADNTAGVVDRVQFGAGIERADLSFRRSGNHLEVSVAGSAGRLTVQDWFVAARHRVESFELPSGEAITDVQVLALVGAMATFTAGRAGNEGHFGIRPPEWPGSSLAASVA